MIFYFVVKLYYPDEEYIEEKGVVIAPSFADAAKQIEDNMFDSLVSIDKLEPIDNTNIIYLTDIPISEQLIQSIKEKAVW